jgi:hypothetical protein
MGCLHVYCCAVGCIAVVLLVALAKGLAGSAFCWWLVGGRMHSKIDPLLSSVFLILCSFPAGCFRPCGAQFHAEQYGFDVF